MSFAAVFAENTGIGYGDHIYINAQTNIFTVGDRCLQLSSEEGALIAFFLTSQLISPQGIQPHQIASQFGESAIDNLMVKLERFDVANDGGNGRLFYEEAIKGRDLFIEDDNGYRFNAPLADLLKTGHVLDDEQLSSINHATYWYKPMVCCL